MLASAGNDLIALNVNFLKVGHVDEVFNVVPVANRKNKSCRFTMLVASPEKLRELYVKLYQRNPQATAGVPCGNQPCTVSQILHANTFWKQNLQIAKIIDHNYQILVNKIKEKTGCKKNRAFRNSDCLGLLWACYFSEFRQ